MAKKDTDAVWWVENFPTASARIAADKAVDALDPRQPMTVFLDTWLAAYAAAGGRRGKARQA